MTIKGSITPIFYFLSIYFLSDLRIPAKKITIGYRLRKENNAVF